MVGRAVLLCCASRFLVQYQGIRAGARSRIKAQRDDGIGDQQFLERPACITTRPSGTDSIIYIPVIYFLIHLEQICRQRFSVLRQEVARRKAGEEHARTQCPLRGERTAWIINAEGCTLGKTILRHFISLFFFLTQGGRDVSVRDSFVYMCLI